MCINQMCINLYLPEWLALDPKNSHLGYPNIMFESFFHWVTARCVADLQTPRMEQARMLSEAFAAV